MSKPEKQQTAKPLAGKDDETKRLWNHYKNNYQKETNIKKTFSFIILLLLAFFLLLGLYLTFSARDPFFHP